MADWLSHQMLEKFLWTFVWILMFLHNKIPKPHHQTRNSRNGAAQQWRRGRQAAARQAAAEAAVASVSLEEREVLDMAAKAVEVEEEATKTVKVAKNAEEVAKDTERVIDDTEKVDKDERKENLL